MATPTSADAHAGKNINILVRTPAGHSHGFDVNPHERVDKVAREAVDYFVGQNLLAAGEYALAVVRGDQAVPLADTDRLDALGIKAGDVLVLRPRAPQVDG